MAKLYASVLVETDSMDSCLEQVKDLLGERFFVGTKGNFGFLCVEAYETPVDVLRGVELPEGVIEHAFYQTFDMKGFHVTVNVFSGATSALSDVVVVLADSLGKHLSARLQCRTLLFVDNEDAPIIGYRSGKTFLDRTDAAAEALKDYGWQRRGSR
jgi:hypothetical protein